MLRATATLSSSDFPEYRWDENELAQVEAYVNSLRPWEFSEPGLGHNKPPADPPRVPATWPTSDPAPLPKLEDVKFAQQVEAIIDSDYPAIWKLILLKIRLRCNHDTLDNAFASNATLMRAASVKDDRTIREAVRDAIKDGILTREDRDGRAPNFGLSKERLQEVIADYIVANRERLGQRRRAKPLPLEPLPSSVGGTSNGRGEKTSEPLPSSGRGDPSHPVGGVEADPAHPVGGVNARPLPSSGRRPKIIIEDNIHGTSSSPTSTQGNGLGLHPGKRTPRRAPPPAPDEVELAVAFYNEQAEKHRYRKCATLTPQLRRRLEARLGDIGGLENFKRAVLAVQRHRFLSGRAPTRAGDAEPFRLKIGVLLQTKKQNGDPWDVLAELLDLACDATDQSSDAAQAQTDLEDAIRQLRKEDRSC
jgi:hypothetical protein